MATMLMVWRSAVCALALLALLCTSVWADATKEEVATAGDVNVSVEVSCARDEQNVRWRFPGESEWTPCATATEASVERLSEEGILTESLCHLAQEKLSGTDCVARCAPSPSGGTAAVCTMNYPLYPQSQLYQRWETSQATLGSASSSLEGSRAADGGKASGESSATAGGRAGGSAGSPAGAASAPQGPSKTAVPTSPAGGDDGTTTTTTTRSPSAGSNAKSNADSGDAIATAWLCAPLLLLLTAALACAAG
ncbi:mucin-like glycoprotein [Trypanosoma conorhini]|uniref:Mucin-like glycoprotein n=1 Tax=Trypanosoma conorhini TaxID=83891 RepID=A0A422NZ68_9TRYP|nr:mucin-like glycoprotein [Trypanosoma conorhini]RNF10793.1 mucin-like glycoprotein [Trypanosoma conorhini]